MTVTTRHIISSTPQTIGPLDDGKRVIIDNSLGGKVSFDPAIWAIEGFQVPSIQRIWRDPTPLFIECPVGFAPSGKPYRVDEFFTYAPLIEPMAEIGVYVANGRLWTTGNPWTRSTGSRQLAGGGTYILTRAERNCFVKCWPSAEGVDLHPPGNQIIVLPPIDVITGYTITDAAPEITGPTSERGAYLWFANVDPVLSELKATIYPYSNPALGQFENINQMHGAGDVGIVTPPGVALGPGQFLGIYLSKDGSRVISRGNAGF